TTHWIRGCLAGLYYCRIYPNGEVTPCPYLPIPLGNIRETAFKDIWFNSEVLRDLRNFDRLKGKCGICSYQDICGRAAGTLGEPVGPILQRLSVTNYFVDFNRGIIDTANIVFYLSLTAGFLFLSTRMLESRRWR
ncbi:MAG: SPASM domain-containing protein, partial [Bacillota bacterium]